MTEQTKNGKAFEYAFANTLYEILSNDQSVTFESNSSVNNARDYFNGLSNDSRLQLVKASKAAIATFEKLEPQLFFPQDNSPLYISLQKDSRGQAGDVRDVIFLRKQNNWEIGISAKHNHTAVKHSRLSNTINFGEKWLNISCGEEYFQEINPIFTELQQLKKEKCAWSDVPDKSNRFYIPLLSAFREELLRMYQDHQDEVPKRLLAYLIGNKDFYKVTSKTKEEMTQIQAFSMYGTLNKAAGIHKPRIKLPNIKFPTKIHDLSLKDNSGTTLLLAMNDGWELSFRIHNASILVEPSLKFDITIVGQPVFYSHFENWSQTE